MDVTPSEVESVMRAAGVDLLIHGHTHRPARHALTVDGRPAERIVLGDWDKYQWWLEAGEDGSLALLKTAITRAAKP
jgi:UDP-2,3-diacylglucosamine hydrolase